MRGCLVLVVGLILGALLVAAFEVFVIPPPALIGTSPSKSDIDILFTNDYMTRLLHEYAAKSNTTLPLEGVVVQAQTSDELVLSGTASATVQGVTVHAPVRVSLRPAINGNRVNVQVIQAQAGNLKIPGTVFQGIAGPLNQQINQTLQGTPYQIVGVNTTVEGLVISVIVKQ